MIATLEAQSPRAVHVSGVPILAETGQAMDTAALEIPLADREAWVRLAGSLRGQFGIIVTEGAGGVAITDLTGCYPVFRLRRPDGETWKLATSLAELEEYSRRSVRRSALCQYVAFGAMDINGETIYSDIDRAAAASVTYYEKTAVETREYAAWGGMAGRTQDDPDAAERQLVQIVQTYTAANMMRNGASEPLGILLSGGTDSALLASLLREEWKGKLHCFTQQFRFKRYSEFDQALENARTLGIATEAVMLGRAKHFEAVRALNSGDQDQPCVTMQAFNLWSMASSVSGRCRRLTLGEHADSLFLGFGHFFHGLPSGTDEYLATTAALSPERKLGWVLPHAAPSDLDKELLAVLDVPQSEYLDTVAGITQARRAKLEPFSDRHLTTLQQLNGQIDGGLSWQRIVLPVERSVGGTRVLTPFFDPAMIALALSLPASLKYRDGKTKFLLRYILRKHIGRELRKQPAAASPVAIWRLLPSLRERSGISPSVRPYYDSLVRRNIASAGRLVNHYIKVAALGLWMGAKRL